MADHLCFGPLSLFCPHSVGSLDSSGVIDYLCNLVLGSPHRRDRFRSSLLQIVPLPLFFLRIFSSLALLRLRTPSKMRTSLASTPSFQSDDKKLEGGEGATTSVLAVVENDNVLHTIAEKDQDEGFKLAGAERQVFTQEEMDAVKRKIDRRVIPLLAAGVFLRAARSLTASSEGIVAILRDYTAEEDRLEGTARTFWSFGHLSRRRVSSTSGNRICHLRGSMA